MRLKSNKRCRRPPQYASAPCKLTIYSYLFARWFLFRHVGYLSHQQQVDLWPFDLESGVRVTCDVGYTSVPILVFLGLSLLDLCLVYATDVRQTDVRQHHRLMPPPYGGEGITSDSTLIYTMSEMTQRLNRRRLKTAYNIGRELSVFSALRIIDANSVHK